MRTLSGPAGLDGLRNFFIDRLESLGPEVVVRTTMSGEVFSASKMAGLIGCNATDSVDWMESHLRVAQTVTMFEAQARVEGEVAADETRRPQLGDSSFRAMPPDMLDSTHCEVYRQLLARERSEEVVWSVARTPVTVAQLLKMMDTQNPEWLSWVVALFRELESVIAAYGVGGAEDGEACVTTFEDINIDDDPEA
jgi:hypothetical protein